MNPILDKIRHLLKLTQSPNENEASLARVMADKLIQKYSITPDQLSELSQDKKEPEFPEDHLLFKDTVKNWKAQLAFLISREFDVLMVEEYSGTESTVHELKYFMMGEKEDQFQTQIYFNFFVDKINELITSKTKSRGPVYIESYCEGVITGIKETFDFSILQDNRLNLIKKDAVSIPKEEKPTETAITVELPKVEKKTKASGGTLVKDIQAYFTGLHDGAKILDNVEDEIYALRFEDLKKLK